MRGLNSECILSLGCVARICYWLVVGLLSWVFERVRNREDAETRDGVACYQEIDEI